MHGLCGENCVMSRIMPKSGELANSPVVSRVTPSGELIKMVQYLGNKAEDSITQKKNSSNRDVIVMLHSMC
jgi:hypothetical protein